MEIVNVLSLFDGMACGRIALERAGIEVTNYFASEIDKHAIAVAKHNYPDIKHIGDVNDLDVYNLPKIDLILAGSPCQGFSMIGKMLNFEDNRSKLFFRFLDILNKIREYNPNVKFLLENVRMKKDWILSIDNMLGVHSVKINSSLVSAQNRPRNYWSNISFSLPQDRNIKLLDILDVPHISDSVSNFKRCVRDLVVAQYDDILRSTKSIHQLEYNGRSGYQDKQIGISKSPCVTTTGFTLVLDANKNVRLASRVELERLQTLPDGYTICAKKTRAAHMIGNGWTVDVIAHILKGIKNGGKNDTA